MRARGSGRDWLSALVPAGAAVLAGGRSGPAPDLVVVNEGEPSPLDPQQGTGVVEGRVLASSTKALTARDP